MRRLISAILIALLACNITLAGFNGYLKADTQVIVTIGPFVDVGDGFTPQTDIDITGTNEAELIKHGSNSVVSISAATWAAITDCRGYYSLTLTTGHTDTEGQITIVIQDDSDCLPVRNTFMVLNDNTFEAFFENAAEILTVDLVQINTIATQLQMLIDASTTINADADLTGVVVDKSVMSHVMTIDADTDKYNATEDSLEAAGIDNDAILADTDDIGVAGVGLTEAGGDGDHLTESAGTGDQLTAINLPNQTMDIVGSITGNLSGSVGSVTAGVTLGADAITAAKIADDAFATEHFATDAISADTINADAWTELLAVPFVDLAAGAPAYNASWFVGMNYIYEAYRNRFVTNTTGGVTEGRYFKNDGTTILAESNHTDDGSEFVREELGAED